MLVSGLTKYLLIPVQAIESLVAKPLELLFLELEWSSMLSDAMKGHARSVLRGAAIALPLLLIFGSLFWAADAAFAAIVKNSLQFDGVQIWQHALLAGGTFWCACGFLQSMHGKGKEQALHLQEALETPIETAYPTAHGDGKQKEFSLGIVEVSVVLGMMNLMFLTFVFVQAQYFFGGSNLVEATTGLTYADYARRGFFELVTVAALLLPVLLSLDFLFKASTRNQLLIFRSLNLLQLGLLFVVMISAVQRMRLYQFEYGMTELRFYTTAFMGWIFVVCLVFIATVLRGKRHRFAFASVSSGLLVVIALHAINPDALIVQANVNHARAGKTFDVQYALSLSNDAVPDLIALAPQLSRENQKIIWDSLKGEYKQAWKTDWRSWNLSRARAYEVVRSYLSTAQDNQMLR